MPTTVIFQPLNEQSSSDTGLVDLAAAMSQQAVEGRVYSSVICTDQKQAEALDELLWQQPADSFIPHNLFGEGDDKPTPLEIIWWEIVEQNKPLKNRRRLINLSQKMLPQPNKFTEILDFVPVEEAAKAEARKRYAQYKQLGCQMIFKQ